MMQQFCVLLLLFRNSKVFNRDRKKALTRYLFCDIIKSEQIRQNKTAQGYSREVDMKRKYDVAAYIWPAYTGDEPRTRMFWKEGIGVTASFDALYAQAVF